MKLGRQTTLKKSVTVSGQGVHSNAPVSITFNPAPAHSGISFIRTNLPNGAERTIEAKWSRVSTTELCTVLGDPSRGAVSTVEHLMAALMGLGIDNLSIEIDGPEVPIMDGSASAFVAAIDWAGIKTLSASRRYIKILKPVRVEHGRSFSELRPAASGFHMDVAIDFPVPVIGAQSKAMELTPARFRREISRARTFGMLRDVEKLWKLGFALGSSLENSIAVDDNRILNPEGLRSADEFVCHKMLDAVGDLALAGAPIVGTYRAFCPGHKMNFLVLQAMFADRSSFEYVEAPARAEPLFADFGRSPMPAFAVEAS
ncbi:UDP-3-O-acyl-N-acetylglucosamine deacetylase [Lichenihabitans sp. Uapishka_5]|uniref:UDP-3-O-acyl-N-acetylglucosamine deacetylase n=1 Tax=Lichenihabitans sp. Uapishka_5 TaxID=3037302 RepID=UPI0029E7F088|nr:UDP-3-O-acyl-N-acetylglucosamine deacetylase [Lichenihabitans sp. Uapishka_5]MDX7952252.1 UDP-3-O-acyl-N-acetylglucosamine deacetylase [Lichenihabitans sp. Uapishka_5]